MGWQYSSAGLSAGSQAAPLVGPDGASTSSASNIGNQRDATGPRCRVGRSQVHRGISEIDGRTFEHRQVDLARERLGMFGLRIKRLPGGHLTTNEQPGID
jgi:hypothetical protein